MNVVILGNGIEEHGWAEWLLTSREHRLIAAYPGFSGSALTDIPIASDVDDALARAGVDTVIVGGPIEERGESLRRAAAEGLTIICLHPPGADSEAYYQVALSRAETGAVIVPDLPLRLHPGVDSLGRAMRNGELGAFRGLRLEFPCSDEGTDLARIAFPRTVDVIRALIGEIEALTATGDPPGQQPDLELVVQLRAAEARRAELRIWCAAGEPARLTLAAANGSLTLEFDPRLQQSSRLIRRTPTDGEEQLDLDPWDVHEAIFAVLTGSCDRRDSTDSPSPNLHDATRAMELAEATVRSLRRGRTVDLHYEQISEESNFKSVMTSTGCMILIGALLAVMFALAGPPLGYQWTIYIAYLIPPILVIFVVLQTLRFAVRKPDSLERAFRQTSAANPAALDDEP
jgi:predicted dehydrogenase